MGLYGFVTIGLNMEDMNMAACNMAVLDVYLSIAAELIGITWNNYSCWCQSQFSCIVLLDLRDLLACYLELMSFMSFRCSVT